jgi:hypothetical protein
MPSGVYQHKKHQGFQKGNKLFLGKTHTEEVKKKLSERMKKNNPMHIPSVAKKVAKKNKGKKRTPEQNKRRSEIFKSRKITWADKLRGENSGTWKGGINPINDTIRKSAEYKEWRRKVFERDNYTCKKCKKNSGTKNAHHIKNFSDDKKNFKISNGITFCLRCHRLFHKIYGFKNNTLLQVKEFLK